MEIEAEKKLVELAKDDIHSFDQLYEYYFPKIYSFCINRTHQKEVAEDIVAQVFVAAIEGLHKFSYKKNARFGSWLYRVTNNKIVDYYKQQNRIVSFEESIANIKSEEGLPEDETIKAEMHNKIAFVLLKIKKNYQEILTMKYLLEYDNQEIATILDIKPSKVAVLVFRATKSFEKKYKKIYKDNEIF